MRYGRLPIIWLAHKEHKYKLLQELRGFAKLKKFQKSKNNLDRAQPTHPPPYPNIFFFWKPISGIWPEHSNHNF